MQYQNLGILQEKKYHVLGIIEEGRSINIHLQLPIFIRYQLLKT